MNKEKKLSLLILIPIVIGVSLFVAGGMTGRSGLAITGFVTAGGGTFLVVAIIAIVHIVKHKDEILSGTYNNDGQIFEKFGAAAENLSCTVVSCRDLGVLEYKDGRKVVMYKIGLDINGTKSCVYSARKYAVGEKLAVHYERETDLAMISSGEEKPSVAQLNAYREFVYNSKSAEDRKIDDEIETVIVALNDADKFEEAQAASDKWDSLYDEYEGVMYSTKGSARFDEYTLKMNELIEKYRKMLPNEQGEASDETEKIEKTEELERKEDKVKEDEEEIEEVEIAGNSIEEQKTNTTPIEPEASPVETEGAQSTRQDDSTDSPPFKTTAHSPQPKRAEIKYKGINKK